MISDQNSPAAKLTTAELEAEFRRRQASPDCTGIVAVWCPVCGDCECANRDDLNDDDCPLHNARSLHAEASPL